MKEFSGQKIVGKKNLVEKIFDQKTFLEKKLMK